MLALAAHCASFFLRVARQPPLSGIAAMPRRAARRPRRIADHEFEIEHPLARIGFSSRRAEMREQQVERRFGHRRDRLTDRRQFGPDRGRERGVRSEEHTSELQSLMRISYAVFCLKKKKNSSTTCSKTHTKH